MGDAQNINTSGVKVPFMRSFMRYNVSALIATAADFLVLSLLHYGLGMYYVYATAIGAVAGAVVSFFLGRHWAFMNKEGKLSTQSIKYIITSGFSLLLNVAGMYLLVDILGISNIIIAKTIIALTVGILFNFPMQRFFIYK